jgi:hypothetical protein
VKTGAAVLLGALVWACAFGGGAGKGSPLKGYRLLVESRDSLSNALAEALKAKGFKVKRRVAGGSPPTAAVVTFTYRDSTVTWLAARLSDTRSGVTVAAVSVPLDSASETAASQARIVADSVAALLSEPAPAP